MKCSFYIGRYPIPCVTASLGLICVNAGFNKLDVEAAIARDGYYQTETERELRLIGNVGGVDKSMTATISVPLVVAPADSPLPGGAKLVLNIGERT